MYLWHLYAGGPLQLHIVRIFRENSLWAKVAPRVFSQELVRSQELYWNRTSVWVFSCKFAAYFQNTFCLKQLWMAVSEWICDIQIKWKLSYVNLLKIIVFELFEHWTVLILFLFLVLIFSVWLTTKPSNLRKVLLEFPKNMIKPSSLQKGFYVVSPVRQFICLTVRLYAFFSGSTQWAFLIFCMRIFCHIY